jgi:acyl carrier protein
MVLKEESSLKRHNLLLNIDNDISYDRISTWTKSWLSDKLNIDINYINDDIPILSYGLDSLSAVELEKEIIAEFNLDFFVGDIFENASIRNFIEFSLDREYVS